MRRNRTKIKNATQKPAARVARTRTRSIADRIDEAGRRFADADALRFLASGTIVRERRLWRPGEKPSGALFEHLESSFRSFARDLSECVGETQLRRLRRFELAQAMRFDELFNSIDRSAERMASITLAGILDRIREGTHLLNITLPKTPGAVLANAIERMASEGKFDSLTLDIDGKRATRDQLVHYQLLSIASVTAATDAAYVARLAADVLDESARNNPRNADAPDWYWPRAPKLTAAGAK